MKFNQRVALDICRKVASGKSLKKICEDAKSESKKKDVRMPSRTVIHSWLLDETKTIIVKGKEIKFYDKYQEAVNIRTENMFDELNEIADNQDINEGTNRSRLRIDTRKWYLSKIMPKKYGDKIDITSNGNELTPILLKINAIIDNKGIESSEIIDKINNPILKLYDNGNKSR